MTAQHPHSAAIKRTVDVVGAVIVRDGRVLCAQRGPGDQAGLWEFPGGKIEDNEPAQAALVREIHEELGCAITVGERVATTVHEYDHVIVSLTTYWATIENGDPVAQEHASLAWVFPGDLHDLNWAPADVEAVHLVARAAL